MTLDLTALLGSADVLLRGVGTRFAGVRKNWYARAAEQRGLRKNWGLVCRADQLAIDECE